MAASDHHGNVMLINHHGVMWKRKSVMWKQESSGGWYVNFLQIYKLPDNCTFILIKIKKTAKKFLK